jgi:hypothetical protein
MMKVGAIVNNDTVSMDLLDWVVIPQCPLAMLIVELALHV